MYIFFGGGLTMEDVLVRFFVGGFWLRQILALGVVWGVLGSYVVFFKGFLGDFLGFSFGVFLHVHVEKV